MSEEYSSVLCEIIGACARSALLLFECACVTVAYA